MFRLFARLVLWTIALVLILIWLIAAGVVWVIEAIVAWRRRTALPSFSIPRSTADPKFGRTAAAAAAVVVVLGLFGGGGHESSGPNTGRADASAVVEADTSNLDPTDDSAATTASVTNTDAASDADAQARSERRAEKARVARRAARRAAHARAEQRGRREAQKAAAAAAAAEQATSNCDPNYEGACLDPNASDYDCAGGSGDGPKYTGTVRVVGSDPYDLDRDGDGIACDS